MNKTNGQKPKTDLALGQSKRLKLLRDKPIIGSNDIGQYYLYPVVTDGGVQESFFAPEPIHNIIQEHNLKSGDEFILSRVQNGSKNSSKLEISLVSQDRAIDKGNTLKETMAQCLRDAVEMTKQLDTVPWRSEDIQRIGVALYISLSR